MGWITKTFDQINLHVYRAFDSDVEQPVYDNSYNWPITQKITPSNLNDFVVNTNAYLEEIHDKDLTHQLYTGLPNGGLMQLVNDDSEVVAELQFQTSGGLHLCYVTYQWNTGFGERVSTSDSGYPAYEGGYDAGMKFRAIISGNNGSSINRDSSKVMLRRMLNGVTVKSEQRYIICSALAIDDLQILNSSVTEIKVPPIPGCGESGSPTANGNVMAFNLVPGVIIVNHSFIENDDVYNMLTFNNSFDTEYVSDIYPTISTSMGRSNWIDISDVTDTPTEEDGYMNDLDNRWSPRFHSNMTAMYVVPEQGTSSPEVSGIRDIADALMTTDLSDIAADLFGAGGSECILGIRWYYGLKTKIDEKTSGTLCDTTVGGSKLNCNHAVGAGAAWAHNYPMLTEFIKWNTSELQVPAHFNNYLDFACSYKLYLPYYGFLDIDANDIVGGTIQVYYNINILTGMTMITVACKNSRTANKDTKYYSVSCTVGDEIPFGSDMVKNMFLQAAQVLGKAGSFATTAGLNIVRQQAATSVQQGQNVLDTIGVSLDDEQTAEIKRGMTQAQHAYNAAGNVQNVVGNISMPKLDVPQRSNGATSESGTLDELHPYLLITRPVNVEPAIYDDYVGVTSSASKKLSTCSGFTQIAAVKPEALTNAPKYVNEIISLLQAGCYL